MLWTPNIVALSRPTSARKLISMIATLNARAPPSMVPRAIDPMKFSLACSSDGGMWTVPAVAGTSVSGTSIFATRIVPGAVIITADSRSLALMPNDIYAAMMPPETCAMPEVMMVISSELVAPARNGRIVNGASVCPMKMLAATLVLSAPLVPIFRCMIHATTLITRCITPMWYSTAKNALTKMIVGSTAKAKVASTLCGSPICPKTILEPSAACPSIEVAPLLATCRMRWPYAHLITRKAKVICRPSPHTTVRHLMARRLVESA